MNKVFNEIKNKLKVKVEKLLAVFNKTSTVTNSHIEWRTLNSFRKKFEVNVFGSLTFTRNSKVITTFLKFLIEINTFLLLNKMIFNYETRNFYNIFYVGENFPTLSFNSFIIWKLLNSNYPNVYSMRPKKRALYHLKVAKNFQH